MENLLALLLPVLACEESHRLLLYECFAARRCLGVEKTHPLLYDWICQS
jgi:hypothetical protein